VRPALSLLVLLLLAGFAGAQEAPPDPEIQAVFDALEAKDLDALRQALRSWESYQTPPPVVRDAVAAAIRERHGTPEAPRPQPGMTPFDQSREAWGLAGSAGAHDLRRAWEADMITRLLDAPAEHAEFYEVSHHLGSPDDPLAHARKCFEVRAALLEHQAQVRPDRELRAWYRLRKEYVEKELLPRNARDDAALLLDRMAEHLEATRDALPEDIQRDRVFSRLQRMARDAAELAARALQPSLTARLWDLFEDLQRREDPAWTTPDWLVLQRVQTVMIPQAQWDEARTVLRRRLAADDPKGEGGASTDRLLLLEVALATGDASEAERLQRVILRGEARNPDLSSRRGLVLLWTGAPGVLVDPGDRVAPTADHPIALALRPGYLEGGITLTFPHRELEYPRTADEHITRWQYRVPVAVHDPTYETDPEAPRWTEVRFDRAAWNDCLDRWDARPDRAWKYEDVPESSLWIACKAAMDWARWEREAARKK
jgi:hypothetical protein